MTTVGLKSPWPAVGYEALPWHSVQDEFGPRPQSRRALGPYSASVPAFIADLDISLNGDLNALTEDVASEMARFDAEVGHLPAPFALVLLRAESAASAEIENLRSGAREIAMAELGGRASDDAQLIAANIRAMHEAQAQSESIGGHAILEIHRALLERSSPQIAGRWRQEQVWIGGGSRGPHLARFVPPHHDRVPALMHDLVGFANRTDLPLLAQTAVVHAQFETIHPFPDGNGRVGRAVIQSMWRGGRLTRNAPVPISAGLLHDTGHYFDALSEYRAGNIAPIIACVAHGAFASMNLCHALLKDLQAVQLEWQGRITARHGSAVHRLLDILLRQPVVGAAAAAGELGVSTVNAQIAIDRLVDAGILTQITEGRRNRIWVAGDVAVALDDFAVEARLHQ
ncbi:Fic family protein [Cryobacterium lyxosi]|uniref:Fic family protein n=1 Tax=Cryobacterium lyxosi TaxID=1259228 RepID=A0A4R8ZKG4_9MICO|nr:Fic family protein [Cryobacterium lyxosi]TFD28665.1 Fic family protein [Cryobacterium lyxosi]